MFQKRSPNREHAALRDQEIIQPRLRWERASRAEVHAIDYSPARLHQPHQLRVRHEFLPFGVRPARFIFPIPRLLPAKTPANEARVIEPAHPGGQAGSHGMISMPWVRWCDPVEEPTACLRQTGANPVPWLPA
jgi:hypothetical protein